MAIILKHQPYIQPLTPAWYEPYVAQMSMLRLDVLHPVISGNKWYKLKHNIAHAIEQGYKSILTFGGGYSNHLIATAAAAKEFGIKAIGIVRGIHDEAKLTDTLKDCRAYGMELAFLTKEEYSKKSEPEFLDKIKNGFDKPFIIPEGGANEWGRLGAEEIAELIPNEFSHVCVSVGTGTTFIGLRNALAFDKAIYGYVPIKSGLYLKKGIQQYLKNGQDHKWELFDDIQFGGFGKWNNELLSFMNSFYETNHIPLDIIYTGKMMFNIARQLEQGFFPANTSLLCIHTGGLQGNSSVKEQLHY